MRRERVVQFAIGLEGMRSCVIRRHFQDQTASSKDQLRHRSKGEPNQVASNGIGRAPNAVQGRPLFFGSFAGPTRSGRSPRSNGFFTHTR